MVQEFSLRLPPDRRAGNFGSVDGDSAAAMRYTEVRWRRSRGNFSPTSDKETVETASQLRRFAPGARVLPSRVPNLLVNGAPGSAAGWPPPSRRHNLREVIAPPRLMRQPDITVDELMEHVPAPDFPTAGILYGLDGCATRIRGDGRAAANPRAAFIRSRRRGTGVDRHHRIPSVEQVPPHRADGRAGCGGKEIEEISDLRDESDRDGGCGVVVELKKTRFEVVLNNLYKQTQMQTSFGVQLLAIVQKPPADDEPQGFSRSSSPSRRRSSPGEPCSCCASGGPRAHPPRIEDRPGPPRRGHQADPGVEGPRSQGSLVARFGLSEVQAQAILECGCSADRPGTGEDLQE